MIEDRPEDNRQEEDPEPTTKDKILKTTLIDYKIIKEPQDWLEVTTSQSSSTNCTKINANNITFQTCLDSENTLKLPVLSKVF